MQWGISALYYKIACEQKGDAMRKKRTKMRRKSMKRPRNCSLREEIRTGHDNLSEGAEGHSSLKAGLGLLVQSNALSKIQEG
ncbi:hypothetical protein PoB_004593700 [Plakobranchus ocellatus]|uniref:Uncharacterized protein n=1 Tax=Plakobranchus ocellatus TaxID=259542 RepID=A0AAV4BJA9_9GAST|nr:hypothetical protein PoB_004593700 [Plakobranchus ocellatus]